MKSNSKTICLLRFNKAKNSISRPLRQTLSKTSSSFKSNLKGGVGYRKYSGESLWLPSIQRPSWLDGSLPGDRGFDPLGLSKPVEYLQFDLDQLDQNNSVNRAGNVVGTFKSNTQDVSSEWIQPYSEVFGLQRFRECELIHGRWAMLATVGVVVAESTTGVSWVQAGKVELEGARYINFYLPFTITQLCWIEAILIGVAEIYRNGNLDAELRIYPGGVFDPLKFATRGKVSDRQLNRLREAEIKHSRLAMISFLGFGIQALTVKEGALGSLYKFSSTLQENN